MELLWTQTNNLNSIDGSDFFSHEINSRKHPLDLKSLLKFYHERSKKIAWNVRNGIALKAFKVVHWTSDRLLWPLFYPILAATWDIIWLIINAYTHALMLRPWTFRQEFLSFFFCATNTIVASIKKKNRRRRKTSLFKRKKSNMRRWRWKFCDPLISINYEEKKNKDERNERDCKIRQHFHMTAKQVFKFFSIFFFMCI